MDYLEFDEEVEVPETRVFTSHQLTPGAWAELGMHLPLSPMVGLVGCWISFCPSVWVGDKFHDTMMDLLNKSN